MYTYLVQIKYVLHLAAQYNLLKNIIFLLYQGIEPGIRAEVWPFLLGV
jgi:hypothetical protein